MKPDLHKEHIVPVRVVEDNEDTMTLIVPKSRDYKFDLSKHKERNVFQTIVFVKDDGNGEMSSWLPWQGE